MKTIAVLLATLITTAALADNPARSPPPEFYSERPVKGERVIQHKSPKAMLAICDKYGNYAMQGRNVVGCYTPATRTIHILAVGAWGTTAREQRCDLIHERGHYIAHMRGREWNHEDERFCQ